MDKVFVLMRALVLATLFIGFFLVFVPARLLARSGVATTPGLGMPQAIGMLVTALGAGLAAWCILTFAWLGRGTPAPFDPPRRLVVQGPYRWVRNPMYIGATAALAGAALSYRSLPLALYAAAFIVALHLFVVGYEEPILRATFGAEYQQYCARVRRWWPRLPARRSD